MYNYLYPRPAVTCDVIVTTRVAPVQILLIKRGNEPFKGSWALPGGFMEMDEALDDCARRELLEETGIGVGEIRQFKTYGNPHRDPRGRTITVAYLTTVEMPCQLLAGDDAAEAEWFHLTALPELAFDHLLIVDDYLLSISD